MSDITEELKSAIKNYGQPLKGLVLTAAEEITTLREQVEKLTKERDESENLRAGVELGLDCANVSNARLLQQLASIASQNEKLKEALDAVSISSLTHTRVKAFVDKALSLPDLSTTVLNKYRAEGMRMAADICSEKHSLSGAEEAIRAHAAELEKTNDLL